MQERIDKANRFASYQFDSLAEATRYIDDTKPTWRQRSSKSPSPRHQWDLGASYDDARRLARDGWPEGAEQVMQRLTKLQTRTPDKEYKIGFYGHMPHVPRYCAGAPDNMIHHSPVPYHGSGKVLTLYVAIDFLAYIRAECAANFGVAVVQYINQLETDGTRVELYAVINSTELSGWNVVHTIKIKSPDQPLDLANVAFALGHPACFRRIGFALMERGPSPDTPGYGMRGRTSAKQLIDPEPNSYIIHGMQDANSLAPTVEQAYDNLERELQRLIERETYNE